MTNDSDDVVGFAARLERRLRSVQQGTATPAGVAAPPEVAGFARAPVPTPAPPPAEVAALQDAEELAALSGRFDPRELLDTTLSETSRQAVLGRLATACTVRPP